MTGEKNIVAKPLSDVSKTKVEIHYIFEIF